MSSPTRPDLPPATRAAPARKIKPLVWILGGISLLLVCAILTVGFLALRAVNAGFALRFDPARKMLVMTKGASKVVVTGGESKEVELSGGGDGKPGLGMAAGLLRVENWHVDSANSREQEANTIYWLAIESKLEVPVYLGTI